MVMQNFGVTKKEHYGMLWYFLERSIAIWQAMQSTVNLKRFYQIKLKFLTSWRQFALIVQGILFNNNNNNRKQQKQRHRDRETSTTKNNRTRNITFFPSAEAF